MIIYIYQWDVFKVFEIMLFLNEEYKALQNLASFLFKCIKWYYGWYIAQRTLQFTFYHSVLISQFPDEIFQTLFSVLT